MHLGLHFHRRFRWDQQFHLGRGHHLYRANLVLLDHLTRPLFRTDLLFLTVPGPHLFREDLENLNLRRFRWDQQFHLVRGHHLYRANLDFLNRPLFPKAPLFLTVRRFHLGQPLH